MREFFTIAIFKIKADIRMNKTTLNSQKEKHSMLSLRRATRRGLSLPCRRRYFYPRSPCGERRCLRWCASISSRQFLSTLSLRRATPPTRPPTPQQYNFYPRSPCGERRQPISTGCPGGPISIHALLAESDLLCQGDSMEPKIFLSTLSLRRATAAGPVDVSGVEISIHALLAESDWATAFHFRSRRQFLSTLSLRRATQAATWSTTWTRISIHALLAESDHLLIIK